MLSAIVALAFAAANVASQPAYSAHAAVLWSRPLLPVASPDGKSAVAAHWTDTLPPLTGRLDVSGAIQARGLALGPGIGAEIAWRPDSKAFFVTTSDEGLNGAYRLLVGETRHGRFALVDLSPLIAARFGHPTRCGFPESPNVGGIAWLPNGHLLAAAQLIAHSNCDSFGTFEAYEVDPRAMTVVAAYGQLEAKAKFGADLGWQLRGARDVCIRDPKSCYVAANHGG